MADDFLDEIDFPLQVGPERRDAPRGGLCGAVDLFQAEPRQHLVHLLRRIVTPRS
jgi:hypothetical protein